MVMALCRKRGALIINSIPFSSSIFRSTSFSFYSSHISRCVRPVITVTEFTYRFPSTTVLSAATLSTHAATTTPSSLVNDIQSNGKYSHPEEETDWPPGCDLEHWLVIMEKPEGEPTRDEIIDTYIKTLSKVLGSEEEARMKIYSVSTRYQFAFGALISEDQRYKIRELPGVRWVFSDAYLDAANKDYGGEPFINGKAVP
ncbi:hypothetical protein MKX03_015697 [Papaver bracteatum]|nr:hypothetical protein MKX03_015697 [Papaver bracteatum]